MLRIVVIFCLISITIAGSVAKTPSTDKKNSFETIILTQVTEPNEQAFNILIPKGWKTEGGIICVMNGKKDG